ncbi:uncharacterized protein LOC9314884 [Arabidopsis lyrata subsp. lyrata]|uniref:uncharacterized protein LOC9314884 n=1 Tax=Arabidopsis lyrata subsp. lyrata TaxID=81972 RepID=UPI000A29C9D6|nr:uncharacterized protein LOC9314884 [Arabidopsis lyrata subsp. lyrata]XP_020883677.1 uncharacterized protein LOC9314884 [Arabidopsis lyrata subsp. lyrata]|eukprot:XP_020883676.1 uncharacterized protein LOC9314884 [Arabidopsis lyrata subsp. lyrata]
MAESRATVRKLEEAGRSRSDMMMERTHALEESVASQNSTAQTRTGTTNYYFGETRLAKLDCPRFSGDKITEWLFKVEQFFEIDRTPDDMKIGLVSNHFDDVVATWHQWMVQSVFWKHVMHDWMTYKMLLQGKFKELEVDPIVELNQLQETNGIEEYHAQFELISTKVNLDEDYLVSLYLTGLRSDTQVNVRMFQPQTIQQCFSIGRLYEYAHPRSNIDNVGILPLKRDSELQAEVDNEEEGIKIEMESIVLEDNLVHGAIMEEASTPQFQVPVSNLETSLRFHNASPVVCEDLQYVVGCDDLFDHQETILQASYTKARDVLLQKSKSVTNNQVAHQVFETLPHREQSKQRHIKCAKWWKFKFKQRRPHKGRPRIAHKWIYRGDFRYKYLCSSAKVALLKHNKLPESWSTLKDDCFMEDKFWKFKFMNRNLQIMREHGHTSHLKLMSDKREHEAMFIAARTVHVRCLLGIMLGITESDAGHGQQAVYEQILMVTEQLLQTSLVLQQAMRNKKIKFSKRWWFKYKSVEEGIKRPQIPLKYKCNLEFDEWFKSWSRRETLCVLFRPDLQEIVRGILLWMMQKQKCPKSWKFKFKSSSEDCKLKCGKSWNFHNKNRLIQGDLVETGRPFKLRLKQHHLLQWLWKSWCSIMLYEFFWERSDEWTQLLCSRILVRYHVWHRWKARCSQKIDHDLDVATYYEQLHVFDGVVVNVLLQHSTDLFIRLQSTKKQRECLKSWMFKFRKKDDCPTVYSDRYLENKKNGRKIRVKKRDYLSWQEAGGNENTKETSGKLQQLRGLCKELMDLGVSFDMDNDTQPPSL